MNILKLNLFKNNLFKQAKYLVSTSERSQPVVMVSETGVISKEILPMYTGYVTAANLKMSWLVLHDSKIRIENHEGQPVDDQLVMLISERSYLPLDPFDMVTPEVKKSIAPLTTIAKIKHAEARANVMDKNTLDARERMLQAVTNGSLWIIGLVVISILLKRFFGGG